LTGNYETRDARCPTQASALAKKSGSPEFKMPLTMSLHAEVSKLSQPIIRRAGIELSIEFDMPDKRGKGGPYRLLLDARADLRHALKGMGLTSADIDGVYISPPAQRPILAGWNTWRSPRCLNHLYTPAKRNGWMATHRG